MERIEANLSFMSHFSVEPEPIELDSSYPFRRAKYVIDCAVAHVLASPCFEVGAWQVAFAIGAPICLGQSMSRKAAELGVSVATFSRGCTGFCRAAGIEPSTYMHSPGAAKNHRKAIKKQSGHV